MDKNASILKIGPKEFPPLLPEIGDAPKELFIRGALPKDSPFYICVVGSRRYTSYGKEACEKIVSGLSGIQNIVIVSGLALGIDGIAHRAALAAGIRTIAVPGSGLSDEVLYPASHQNLAHEILKKNGALLSEFPPDFRATTWSFPRRNRIMAGLSHMIILIEAEERSGSLITARLGLDYNRTVAAVPGPITHPTSQGTNSLIKDGATPISSAADILESLGIAVEPVSSIGDRVQSLSENERIIYEILREPMSRDEIIQKSNLPVRIANITLSLLENNGYIKETAGMIRRAQ